ncbi:MAG: hypothetical protein MI864_28135 [Pseudomonadales bacterium]|nr:hypothetical protein [Pseudomonadales bacterium]
MNIKPSDIQMPDCKPDRIGTVVLAAHLQVFGRTPVCDVLMNELMAGGASFVFLPRA